MAVIDELLIALGYDYDPEELKQFQTDLKRTTDGIKSLIKTSIAGAVALTGLVVASSRASSEQKRLALEINESVETVDALGFALARSGGQADSMTSSLRQLAIVSAEANRGVGAGIEVFGILGVSVQDAKGQLKSVSELMLEISGQLKGLDRSKQIELASKLGLTDSIRLLQQGPDAIRELIAEAKALGVTTEEDAALSIKFQDSLINLWRIVKQGTRLLTKELVPAMTKINEEFTDWWKINRDMITQNIPKWIEQFTVAMRALSAAVAAFVAVRIIVHLISFIARMKSASVFTLLFNAALLILPTLIATVAFALAALIEDAGVFFRGGDSFIQDMLDKWPKWTDEIIAASAALATIGDLVTMIFDGWSKIFDLFANATFDDETIQRVISFVGDVAAPATLDAIRALSAKVFEALPKGEDVAPAIGDLSAKVFGGQPKGEDVAADPIFNDKTSQQVISFVKDVPVAASAAANEGISNVSKTVIDKIDIVIQGGADTAENIADAVLNTFQQAVQDLSSAVDQ